MLWSHEQSDLDATSTARVSDGDSLIKSTATRRDMFIRVNHDGYGDGFLGAPPARFKKGGLPVSEDDAHHLLTILAGPSSYQPYLDACHGQPRHHGPEEAS